MTAQPSASRFPAEEGTGAAAPAPPEIPAARSDRPAPAPAEPLSQLGPAWTALEASAVSPTQDFIWSRACAETLHDPRDIRPISVPGAGPAIAIAPLVRTSSPIPRLEAIGVHELFEPMDFIYADPTALAALAERVARQPLPLRLQRIPADSPMPAALERAFHGRGLVRVTPTSPCPYIDLDPSWTEPDKHFNSGRRSDFRRARRHADSLGAVTFEVLSPEPADVERLMDEALAVEAQSWKGTEGSALASDPVRGRFFRRYAASASAKGILRMVFMRIAGAAVGMQIAIESHKRFWLFKIGYDERVGKCSPGNLLMLHSVQFAAERGLLSYEFLGAAAPWTATWTKTLRDCVNLRTYPISLGGAAALAYDGGRWTFERLRRRLRKQG